MKTTLRIEEAAKFILSYWLTMQLGFPWWGFLAWLLAPDISAIGYLINPKIGGFVYNVFHHQAVAILVGVTGWYLQNPEVQFAGILLFGHSAMDRVFGYGLKFPDNFKHTHLGWIGKTDKQ